MVRVKSEAYTKAAVKAPRKQTVLRSDSTRSVKCGKASKYSGGNSYCPRTTPDWQKPITSFFSKNESQDKFTEESASEVDTVACISASSPNPVPGCSKDDSEPIEEEGSEPIEVEEPGKVSDEESNADSASEGKKDEESHAVSSASECDGPEI